MTIETSKKIIVSDGSANTVIPFRPRNNNDVSTRSATQSVVDVAGAGLSHGVSEVALTREFADARISGPLFYSSMIDYNAYLNFQISDRLYMAEAENSNFQSLIPLDDVVKMASFSVGAVSLISIVAYIVSGLIIIHPIVAVSLLLSSIFFYLMTKAK